MVCNTHNFLFLNNLVNFFPLISKSTQSPLYLGNTIDDAKMKSISGSLLVDDKDEYAFNTAVRIDRSKARIQLSPMVEQRRAGAADVKLTGSVTVITPFKAADVVLSLSGVDKMPYTLTSEELVLYLFYKLGFEKYISHILSYVF